MINFFKKKQNKEENNFDNFPPIGGLMVSKMVVDENIKQTLCIDKKEPDQKIVVGEFSQDLKQKNITTILTILEYIILQLF